MPTPPLADPFEGLHSLNPRELAIDEQLSNWGAWSRPRGGGRDTSPMFRLFRSSARARSEYAPPTRMSVRGSDALRVEHAVRTLLPAQALVLRWYYVWGGSPHAAVRAIREQTGGCETDELVPLLRRARWRLAEALEDTAAPA